VQVIAMQGPETVVLCLLCRFRMPRKPAKMRYRFVSPEFTQRLYGTVTDLAVSGFD
jgi:hypothetical protein